MEWYLEGNKSMYDDYTLINREGEIQNIYGHWKSSNLHYNIVISSLVYISIGFHGVRTESGQPIKSKYLLHI